jgi:hypothetical protein
MFAIHISNPFTASSRREERDRKVMDIRRHEREQHNATSRLLRDSVIYSHPTKSASDDTKIFALSDRAKYQFEVDSEDDEMENEIDTSLGVC